MAVILNLVILDSAILVFPLKLTHTFQDWFPLFAQKKTFTHSFWLNLMMAAILKSAMLDSDTAILDSNTLLSSLRFTQKHSPSTLTLTQTKSIWLTRWWQPSWILLSWIQPFCTKKSFTCSFWLHLMMAAIFNSAILDSAILHKTLTQTTSIWLKLIHSHPTWWYQPSWILPSWIQPFCTKRTSLIHSDSTWWWQPSWILPCWMQTLPSWIQTPCYLLSDSLKNTLPPLWLWLKLIQSD